MDNQELTLKTRPCFLTPKPLKPEYPLFVFLPGMDGTGQLLRSQLNYLEIGFDIRALAISPWDMTSWEALAEEVSRLIEAELKGKRRQVYLCGESFGGCLALQVIKQIPHLIDRLILINPATSFHRLSWLSFGSQLVHWLPGVAYHYSTVGLATFLAEWELLEPANLEELIKVMQMIPQKTTVWRLSLLREFRLTEMQLARITQPVLLIAGGRDRLLPSVSESKWLASRLNDAKRLVLPESGHACLLEADVDLYQILKSQNFLDRPTLQTRLKSAIVNL